MDKLNADLATLDTALATVKEDVAALATAPADPSVAVVSSMVTALEGAGYTVTAPATSIPVTDGDTETPAEESTDTPTES